MKRDVFMFPVAVMVYILAIPLVAAKEKAKSGVLTSAVFIDSAFGYGISIPPNWKAKVKDEPSLVRLALEKSDVQINPRFNQERLNAGTRPRFLVLADTTSLSAEEFLSRIFGEANWKGKGEYLKLLDWRSLDQEVSRTKITVANQAGLQLTFLRDMTVYFAEGGSGTSAGSELRAQVVTVFKRRKQVFVTVLFTSHFFLESNFKDVMPVFSGWKFLDQEKASGPGPSGN